MKELYTNFLRQLMLLLHPERVLTGASVEKTNLTL